jgi:SWI/SNF-related matrix-associated actin-dependent regulator of chromatin subfamily A-like protein 1
LPHTGGSHKAGFRVAYSNSKGDFHLDGVFNVISYDVVPKIQSTLLDLDFKVDFLSYTSFRLWKNGQRNMPKKLFSDGIV